MSVLAIFALAGVLCFLPALVDRWAVRRGASPETLAALALVTLTGIAAVPVTFAVCAGTLAAHDHDGVGVAAVAGLLLVAVAAGRTLARSVRIRRRWAALSRVAAALELHEESGGVKVLPVGDLLAFSAGTQAFVSEGLLRCVTPEQRRAVLEHEREHAERRHGRLLGAARAVTHGAFHVAPARRASDALDRELDVLADRAAARRLGDPRAVGEALRAVAAATSGDGPLDQTTRARIERLARDQAPRRRLADAAVRLATVALAAFVLAAICLSLHASTAWLGVTACVLLIAGFISFTRPSLKAVRARSRNEEARGA